MWAVLLIAFSVMGGRVDSTTEECDIKHYGCHDMYPESRMEAADKAPDEAELESLCPVLVKMADCFQDYIKECTDFANFPLFPFYNRDGKFFKEICSKNSLLRSKYLSNVDCFKRKERKNLYTQCYKEAAKLYDEYIQNKSVSEPERVLFSHCKRMPYVMGCEAVDVQNSCGDQALETFIEMEKLKDSTNEIKFCLQNSEQRSEIYNDFLPSLQLTENLRSKINKFLDSMDVDAVHDHDY